MRAEPTCVLPNRDEVTPEPTPREDEDGRPSCRMRASGWPIKPIGARVAVSVTFISEHGERSTSAPVGVATTPQSELPMVGC